jgi:hypothetical protein
MIYNMLRLQEHAYSGNTRLYLAAAGTKSCDDSLDRGGRTAVATGRPLNSRFPF